MKGESSAGGDVSTVGTSNILGASTSLGSSSILGGVSSLGSQTIGSVDFSNTASSILGQVGMDSINALDNDINEAIVDGDNSAEEIDEADVTLNVIEEPEIDVTIPVDNETEDDEIEDDQTEEDDTIIADSDGFLSSTTNDDILSGGNEITEFLFDGTDGIGGNDVITDTGTSTDDRIYIKNMGLY